MAEERDYKITCNECGYSEMVPQSRLPYEEGKTCPSCYKGKMYWVTPAEEARRIEARRRPMPEEERRISIAWAIPAVLLLAVGGGMALALALSEAARPGIELQPEGNTVKWTGGPTHVEDALADIIGYVDRFLVLRETDQVWIEITRDIWDTWTIPRDQICEIYVDRACTVTGFVWA